MMGLAINWRKEKMEPRKPPNSTVLNSSGAPTLVRNQSTFIYINISLESMIFIIILYLVLESSEQTATVILSIV